MESDSSDDNDDVQLLQKTTNDKSTNCSICGKKFNNPWDCKHHEQTHAPDFPYKCPLCPFRAKTKKYISRHNKRMHLEIKGPTCKVCGKVFLFRSKLKEHAMVHTGEKPFKCDYCPKAFRVSYSLKCHLLIHSNEKPYQCSFCNYSCRDNSTLRKHQNKHMGIIKLYNCSECSKGFKHKYMLKDHISEFHMNIDIRNHKCEICQGTFKSYSLLAAHVRIVHEKIYASKCEICGLKVTNRYNLKYHMLTHMDYKAYRCTFKGCTRKFKTMGYLKKHTIIHKPELHFKCNKCDATFSRRCRLERHRHTHKKRKKHVICDYCGVSFYSKNYIIKHIKETHTDRQLFECDECGFQSKNKPGLVMHMRYGHLECKKENECSICHTKYKKYEYLKSHYLRTHNIKYKMVKPYAKIKEENEPNETKPEVIVKMEPIDEEYEALSLLDIDKEEIQDPDDAEYSRKVLTEDVTNCILRPNGNCDENEFDQFLVDHMLSDNKDETDNIELAEVCDQEILKKTNDRIAELLKTSEKIRLAEKKSRAAKKLAKKKKREEEELIKKQQNELKELELLRVKYNEIIRNLNNTPKKKENTKIIYYKANTKNISNEKDPIEKNDENDFEDNEIGFAVKPNKVNDKSNGDSNEVDDDKNNDVSNNNGFFSDGDDYSEEDISFAIKPTKTNSKLNDKNHLHDESDEDNIPHDEMNNKCDETNNIRVENDNLHAKANDVHDENSETDNICDESNDKPNETNVINDENSDNDKGIYTRSGRKLKPKKFFGDENEKHPKMSFKSHQCYICFKLYPTKEELIDHCRIHFDLCSLKTLKKCPICNFVTHKCLTHHLLKKHDINLKIPFQNIEEKTEKTGSKYYYNADGTIIDVIPSVKSLNFNANKAIEKQNKARKNKAITKTKLVKNGSEWIVQTEDLNTTFDLLPEFSETEYKKLKISDNYIDRFKQIYKLTKKRNLKMAFPCLDCTKICQNASALKLHNRVHQENPKPFRARAEVRKEKLKKAEITKNREVKLNIDKRKPKPIKNKHKCDEKLKQFYETNIKGGDIEFRHFLKIFNKMDREDINEFEQLENRKDFGIHTMKDKRLIVNKNKRTSNTLKKKSNTFKKQNTLTTNNNKSTVHKHNKKVPNTAKKNIEAPKRVMLTKKEQDSRNKAKNKLRNKLLK